ncbi:MAG: heavy metal-binding domain-containing protein, partial [Deltaproteobacteria bacterium]|nr:heavy metal-binding domain-containing protein [Deltaproteobacteria bacterium]
MILTTTTPTTSTAERKPARGNLGTVTGEAIPGANFVKDFFAGIRDIVVAGSGLR